MSDKINPFEKKKKGVFFFKSSNPYEFYDLLNGKNMDDKQDVWGTLIFPENVKKLLHIFRKNKCTPNILFIIHVLTI